MSCKLFLGGKRGKEDPAAVRKQYEALAPSLKPGSWLKVKGEYRYDDFAREMVLRVSDAEEMCIRDRWWTAWWRN